MLKDQRSTGPHSLRAKRDHMKSRLPLNEPSTDYTPEDQLLLIAAKSNRELRNAISRRNRNLFFANNIINLSVSFLAPNPCENDSVDGVLFSYSPFSGKTTVSRVRTLAPMTAGSSLPSRLAWGQ